MSVCNIMLAVLIELRRALLAVSIGAIIVLKIRKQGLRLSLRSLLCVAQLVFFRNISRASHRLNAYSCCFSRSNCQTYITGTLSMFHSMVAGYFWTWLGTLLSLNLHGRNVSWKLLVSGHTGILF